MNQREQRGGSPKQKIRSYGMKMNATASSAPIFSTTSFVSCVARFLDFAFRVEKTGAPLARRSSTPTFKGTGAGESTWFKAAGKLRYLVDSGVIRLPIDDIEIGMQRNVWKCWPSHRNHFQIDPCQLLD